MYLRLASLFVIILYLAGCGVNPVTGKTQVTLMSPAQEIAIGKRQYSPSQQSQGGAYIIDKQVNDLSLIHISEPTRPY